MKALNCLRHLAVLLLFALAAATASAAPGDAGTKKVRKTANRPAVEPDAPHLPRASGAYG